MTLHKKQTGFIKIPPIAAFGIIAAIVVVGALAYTAYSYYESNKGSIQTATGAGSVHDPDPNNDDECEKDPNCLH